MRSFHRCTILRMAYLRFSPQPRVNTPASPVESSSVWAGSLGALTPLMLDESVSTIVTEGQYHGVTGLCKELCEVWWPQPPCWCLAPGQYLLWSKKQEKTSWLPCWRSEHRSERPRSMGHGWAELPVRPAPPRGSPAWQQPLAGDPRSELSPPNTRSRGAPVSDCCRAGDTAVAATCMRSSAQQRSIDQERSNYVLSASMGAVAVCRALQPSRHHACRLLAAAVPRVGPALSTVDSCLFASTTCSNSFGRRTNFLPALETLIMFETLLSRGHGIDSWRLGTAASCSKNPRIFFWYSRRVRLKYQVLKLSY